MAEPEEPRIPSHMGQAVWATVLCFPPTGAWAIFHASRAIALLDEGDREGALRASRSARKWARISFVLGALMLAGTVAVGVGLILYVQYYLVPAID